MNLMDAAEPVIDERFATWVADTIRIREADSPREEG
jgi:hypothetical protein